MADRYREFVDEHEDFFWWDEVHDQRSAEEVENVVSVLNAYLDECYEESYSFGRDLEHVPFLNHERADYPVSPSQVGVDPEDISKEDLIYCSRALETIADHEYKFKAIITMPELENGRLGSVDFATFPISQEDSLGAKDSDISKGLFLMSMNAASDSKPENSPYTEKELDRIQRTLEDGETAEEVYNELVEYHSQGLLTEKELDEARDSAISRIKDETSELRFTEPKVQIDKGRDVLMTTEFPLDASSSQVLNEMKEATAIMENVALMDYGLRVL